MSKEKERKAELHQLLLVETNLQGLAKKVMEEAVGTFGKRERFTGTVKTLKMFDESRKGEEATEVQDVTTTVEDKLGYVEEALERYWDAFLQKESTNQAASADLIVDGKVLASAVPATALLGFETKLKELRAMYEAIPTLAPGIKWETTDIAGVFANPHAEDRMKTEKTIQFKEVSKATDKHPAQVEKWTADVPVGKYTTTTTSSAMSVARKSELLGRIDKLIQAVMAARMSANSTEIVNVTIGSALINFIHGRL